MAVTMGWRK